METSDLFLKQSALVVSGPSRLALTGGTFWRKVSSLEGLLHLNFPQLSTIFSKRAPGIVDTRISKSFDSDGGHLPVIEFPISLNENGPELLGTRCLAQTQAKAWKPRSGLRLSSAFRACDERDQARVPRVFC